MFATAKAVPATAVTAVAAVETTAAPALKRPTTAGTEPVATGIICISPLPLIDKKSKDTSKLFILIL